MTIKDERNDKDQYMKLKFVEFLEFVARIAYAKYCDDEETELVDKVILIMDVIFPRYGRHR